MSKLYLLFFILPLCQGFPLHSEKSKSNSSEVKSQGRQYVSQGQQPVQGMAGNQPAYGQYPGGYGAVQTQYDQQQYDQPQQQMTDQPMPSKPANKGHTGTLYSRRPVPDHDKDISPPKDKKEKKKEKKKSKSKKQDDEEK